MSKNLDAAIDLMVNGWCTGELKEMDAETGQDTYCAVGAVAEAAGFMSYLKDGYGKPLTDYDGMYYVDESAVYKAFNTLPEAKFLAEQVMKDEFHMEMWGDNARMHYVEGEYDEVVFEFNDTHEKEDVILLFKNAKVAMDDAQVHEVSKTEA